MMSFALRKRNPEERELDDLNKRLHQLEDRSLVYLNTIRTFIYMVKEFSIDIGEFETAEFREQMDRFGERFSSETKANRAESRFEKIKPVVLDFIQRQKRYLKEREDELKEIIDLLSKAMVNLNSDNAAYHQKIIDQSVKLEKITLLDDIKKIKTTLAAEIESIKDTVRQKQIDEHKQVSALSDKVETLNVELQRATTASLTDELTRVANRRAFDRTLRSLVDQNLVGKRPFSLIMIDIDDFKQINDRFGHLVGDRALAALARGCSSMIRSDDFIARYGGEEFAILLPGASLRNAVKKAKHLCREIAKTLYAVDENEGDGRLTLTASMGVAAFHKGDTPESVVSRADQALYRAKAEGKNRVVG